MAHAPARRIESHDLEENGIVRSAVFPNAVRDVRRSRGFPTLRDFDGSVDVTYTRLAKIERGEIFPAADELTSIADALKVPVGRLLVDPSEPSFDREQWARDHIEAKLRNRGGGLDAMRLGAAVRVARLALGRSTTDMKSFGLPAATVSRIENAERPVERWDAQTMRGIAQVLGLSRANQVEAKVAQMFDGGELDDMLQTLFSPEAIDQRNSRRLRTLLADLPGSKAAKLLQDLNAPVEVAVFATRPMRDGRFRMTLSDRMVRIPEDASRSSFAIEMASAVVGPGLPEGCVVIADPAATVSAGDVVVVRRGDAAQVVIAADIDGTLRGVSTISSTPVDIEASGDAVVARMVSTVFK